MKFLFDKGKLSENQFMDMRTVLGDNKMFQAIYYYRVLEEECGSKAAGDLANILERLLISSYQGRGRKEAVTTLMQRMPKVETLVKGVEEELKKTLEEVSI